nr:PepSY domain-containing protein [uncultured Mediterraneibacter sp.]
MKRLAIAAIISLTAAGAFAGCGAVGGSDIGQDAALQTALNDAGVSESDTTRLQVSSDRDDGRKIYEIRFDVDQTEYDYEILASDGTILSSDTETRAGNTQNGQTDGTQSGTGQTDSAQQNAAQNNAADQNQQGGAAANVAVSREDAIATALAKVPGATENDIRIELDLDDGRQKYEGDIIYNQMEYDFEIDANTGEVISWSEERP